MIDSWSHRTLKYTLVGYLILVFIVIIALVAIFGMLGFGDSHTAVRMVERDWSQNWVQSGASWITKSPNRPLLLQIKNRSIDVTESNLSESDRLNGIQWRGEVNVNAEAERFYAVTDFSDTFGKFETGWTRWMQPGSVFVFGQELARKQPITTHTIEKHSGEWKILSKSPSIPMGPLREKCQKPLDGEIPK